MNTVRLVKGEIFFDDFTDSTLNEKWTVMPNDALRYSLTERPGFINMYHGLPDLMMLIDEPNAYVFDIKNDYVPDSDAHQAGIIAFRGIDDSLEVLEYFDTTKDASFVYQYIRVIKDSQIYTVYGRNSEWVPWELIGSLEFQSAGKVGLIVKGPWDTATPTFSVDYVRVYKNQEIQIINVPLGYKVELYKTSGELISAKRVTDPYKGVKFTFEEIPPVYAYFRIYDEGNVLLHTTNNFDMCGGDTYFYGASLEVYANTNELHQDKEFFLGYYKHSIIDFDVEVKNPFDVEFPNVVITAMQYGTDISYSFVKFSLDGITYETALSLGNIPPNSNVLLKGQIIRNLDYEPSDITPAKFNIKVTNS